MLAPVLIHFVGDASPSTSWGLEPGDAGWGDVLFVSIWVVLSLALASYYCYKAFFAR